MLDAVLEEARKHNVILVAPWHDRFPQSRRFDGTNESEAPTVDEYMELKRRAGTVPLATLCDPDALPGKVRSSQTKRGQQAKGRKGGRPRKPIDISDEERKLMIVILAFELGIPQREIAVLAGVSTRTVSRRLKAYRRRTLM